MRKPPISDAAKETLARYRAEMRSPAPHFCYGRPEPPPPPQAEPPEIGERKTFLPAANLGGGGDIQGVLHQKVTGTVVYVHREHRWYRVAYQMGSKPGCIGFECFKF